MAALLLPFPSPSPGTHTAAHGMAAPPSSSTLFSLSLSFLPPLPFLCLSPASSSSFSSSSSSSSPSSLLPHHPPPYRRRLYKSCPRTIIGGSSCSSGSTSSSSSSTNSSSTNRSAQGSLDDLGDMRRDRQTPRRPTALPLQVLTRQPPPPTLRAREAAVALHLFARTELAGLAGGVCAFAAAAAVAAAGPGGGGRGSHGGFLVLLVTILILLFAILLRSHPLP